MLPEHATSAPLPRKTQEASGAIGGQAIEDRKAATSARWRTLLALPVHPFLVGSAFVLNLWAENLLDAVRLTDVLHVWAAVLVAVAGVGGLILVAVRNSQLAGILTTGLVVWTLAFGPLRGPLQAAVGEELVLVAWLAAGAALGAVAVGARRWLSGLTRYLNVVSFFVVLVNLSAVVPYQIASAAEGTYQPEGLDSLGGLAAATVGHGRDIYYIILDRYPSQRTLAGTAYDYDNSAFVSGLEQRGFYVAPFSHANYTFTALSLASSLNMNYLDAKAMAGRAPASNAWKPVYDMLAGSLAAPQFLERLGYTYVQVAGGFEPTAAGAEVDVRYRHPSFSEFATALYRSTFFAQALKQLDMVGPDTAHQDNALFQFDQLMNLDQVAGPKFVFAHILLPHPPYAFDRDGPLPSSEVTDGRDAPPEAFLGQLEYTNGRVLQVVDQLIAGSDRSDPVVIIQADEGPYTRREVSDWHRASPEEYQVKFGILNAYYMPGIRDGGLYPNITPVNTFRLLFNSYFGAGFPLLDDRIYAMGKTIYDNVDITDQLVREQPSEVPDPDRVVYHAAPPTEWRAGATQGYEVTVRNTGDITWQSDGPDAVSLRVRFSSLDPESTSLPEQAFRLQRDVAPGQTATLRMQVTAPDADGTYRLQHRLVHGVTALKAGPAPRVTVRSSLETWDRLLAANYAVTAPRVWTQGSRATYEVRITNEGPYTWNALGDRPVRLGIQFGDESDVPEDGWVTDERYWLPHDVAPGASAVLEVDVTAPEEPGHYVLRHRMVKENTSWFSDVSRADVEVTERIDATWLILGTAGVLLVAGLSHAYSKRRGSA